VGKTKRSRPLTARPTSARRSIISAIIKFYCSCPFWANRVRGVAQPGRAPGSGPGGRRFKSSLPDHLFSSSYTPSKSLKIPAVGKNATVLTSLVFYLSFLPQKQFAIHAPSRARTELSFVLNLVVGVSNLRTGEELMPLSNPRNFNPPACMGANQALTRSDATFAATNGYSLTAFQSTRPAGR